MTSALGRRGGRTAAVALAVLLAGTVVGPAQATGASVDRSAAVDRGSAHHHGDAQTRHQRNYLRHWAKNPREEPCLRPTAGVSPKPAPKEEPSTRPTESSRSAQRTPAPTASPSPKASSSSSRTSSPAPSSQSPSTSPSSGAVPDAASTGPRSGHTLKAAEDLTITKNGTTLTDLDIDGCVIIQASDVVLSDVRIRCTGTYAINVKSGSVTVKHTEIDGTGNVHVAVVGDNYTLDHVEIYNIEDGPRLGSNVTITNSYIHDLFRTATSHNDAMQTTGGTNITIRNNHIAPYTDGDPMNAAIMIGSESAPLRNMTIEGNYLDGGNYTILARTDLNGSNITVRNNQFTRNYRYGPYRGTDAMNADNTNVYAGTTTPIF